MRVFKHIALVLTGLFVFLGIPALLYVDVGALAGGGTDGVSGASMVLPERPSGEFVVLLNREKHPETLAAWADFFSDRPVDVIMEDVRCTVLEGDSAGRQLAERYQARLAENQMGIRPENGLLAVSKAEKGLFDVMVLSQEAAEAYQVSTVYPQKAVQVIQVKGAAE